MSSRLKNSLISLNSFSKEDISSLFTAVAQLEHQKSDLLEQGRSVAKFHSRTGALIFFESSTRTRLSFETACARLLIHPLIFDMKIGSSLEKGETFEDTVLNIAAMKPSFVVIRCGDELDLENLAQKIDMPILNAGWGRQGHPTQALLDAYTIRKHLHTCENQRVLIVGDVRHSRVAASHLELAPKLGYEIAFCGPQEFLPEKTSVKVFSNLQEGLKWSTVAMALRVQLERHTHSYSLAEYRDLYGFTQEHLKVLSDKALILHPGPINQGTEMDIEVMQDSRAKILDQVSNGVLVRQALIQKLLSQELS